MYRYVGQKYLTDANMSVFLTQKWDQGTINHFDWTHPVHCLFMLASCSHFTCLGIAPGTLRKVKGALHTMHNGAGLGNIGWMDSKNFPFLYTTMKVYLFTDMYTK